MILGNLALSPDGKRLAFTADTGGVLWIRALDGTTAKPTTVGGDAALPFWSPDSRFVAFFSDGKLKKVDSAGGMIQTICDAESGGGGSWGPRWHHPFCADECIGAVQSLRLRRSTGRGDEAGCLPS